MSTSSTSLPVVDCADRHPACLARCCSLEVHLSDEEMASGRYRTQAERPRYLERAESGLCIYHRPGPLACSIHDERPAACRAFSCYGDVRIWRDFEARRTNEEALHALLHRGRMPPRAP